MLLTLFPSFCFWLLVSMSIYLDCFKSNWLLIILQVFVYFDCATLCWCLHEALKKKINEEKSIHPKTTHQPLATTAVFSYSACEYRVSFRRYTINLPNSNKSIDLQIESKFFYNFFSNLFESSLLYILFCSFASVSGSSILHALVWMWESVFIGLVITSIYHT